MPFSSPAGRPVSPSPTAPSPAGPASFERGAAYIDGCIVPIAQARIPILDLGFLHSDATYDVAHVWQGRVFRLDAHLDRFLAGMRSLRLSLPFDRSQIQAMVLDCVRRTGLRQAYVEMICTRGLAAPGSRDPRDCTNQFYAFAIPFQWIADARQRQQGLRLQTSSVQRIPPGSVDPTVKNYHWLDLVRGLFDAYDQGAENAVLTDGQGNVVEGPGFNIFAVQGQSLVTPDSGVLQGITRMTVLELAHDMGLPVQKRALPIAELLSSDEVFITSTAGGVMPVGMVNGQRLAGGRPGAAAGSQEHTVTAQIARRYWDLHTDARFSLSIFD
jgi:branched-chain amino acid aminotransferase